jgi:hypothetical protein
MGASGRGGLFKGRYFGVGYLTNADPLVPDCE